MDHAPAVDPVCGMTPKPDSPHRYIHDGHDFVFCSEGCKTKFAAAPERYLSPRDPDPTADPKAIYTCPMHPEIEQVGPGDCPICGMSLELKTFDPEAPGRTPSSSMTTAWLAGWAGRATGEPPRRGSSCATCGGPDDRAVDLAVRGARRPPDRRRGCDTVSRDVGRRRHGRGRGGDRSG